MNIIPELNLNKHPKDVKNNSLVDAHDVMVSNDGSTLQSENYLGTQTEIDIFGANIITTLGKINIIYSLPCNKEILFFNLQENNTITIIRYNELLQQSKIVLSGLNYNNGKLLGTFTYNKNDLIVAISEYEGNIEVPLKTINFGKWEDDISQNLNKLDICPKVKIPTLDINYLTGLCYKGWHFIFIRYKIDEYNYTQWYNTNASVFIDDFTNKTIINYAYYSENDLNQYILETFNNTVVLSSDTDLSQTTFKVIVKNNNLNNIYSFYQLGFINVTKIGQNAFRSIDLSIDANEFVFSSNLVNISVTELLKTYYNYYNVKTLDVVNNRLYIGNYNTKDITNIDLSNITLNVSKKITDLNINFDDIETTVVTNISAYHESSDFNDVINTEPIEFTYVDTNGTYLLHGISAKYFFIKNADGTLAILGGNDTDEIKASFYNGTNEEMISTKGYVLSKNLIYVPKEDNTDKYGYYDIGEDQAKFITNTELTIYVDNNSGELNKTTINTEHTVTWIVSTKNIIIPTNAISLLNSNGVMPLEKYKLYIHFIDEYGEATPGYDISNLRKDDYSSDYFENGLFKSDNITINQKLEYTFTIQNIPNGYIGAYISYEKFETNNTHKGIVIVNNKIIKFYSDSLNFSDNISFNFNKLKLYNIEIFENKRKGDKIVSIGSYIEEKNISYKQLYVADSLNNELEETYIQLIVDEDINDGKYFGILSNEESLYNSINKILIPASNVAYVDDNRMVIDFNTKNSFSSTAHALIYPTKVYFDDGQKAYIEANKTELTINKEPAFVYKFTHFYSILNESLSFNNTPYITYFPIKNINNESTGSMYIGAIVDIKNTIDLFKENQSPIYNLYPKIQNNYVDNNYINVFNNTLRRSNIIQDESNINSWRIFNTEEYRNINENKGNIIKLIGIGKYFIVHTEHSMFLFNGTDTIKSDEGGIQLASVDLMNLSYQEVVTSRLGYAGLQKEHHGIIGTFGYIFYSVDDERLYKYDNNKLEVIDENITNFIKKNHFNDIIFVDDKKRNRLIIKFINTSLNISVILSYNYLINSFVSLHSYNFEQGYSTKNEIYLISNENNICQFYENFNNSNSSNISIMINTDYELMKYLDVIKYKIIKKPLKDFLSDKTEYKPIASLQIYSEYGDTGVIPIIEDNVDSTNINSINNYVTPYWRFGNWHFNAIRNKIMDNTVPDDKKYRIFGNWFVVKFVTNNNNNYLTVFETLDCKLSLDEN